MKVSVCMITYNQEQFIAQAIDSVLMQETDFEYELVIGEDCSTDRTRQVCVDYQRRFPDQIRLLLHPTNRGGKRNFMESFSACSGTYVAILEGDDYWIDTTKLQKQVDFLDSHPDHSVCFTKTACYHQTQNRTIASLPPREYRKATLTLEDLLRCNFVVDCSVMFRNKLFDGFPRWYALLEIGDWPLHLINAQYGKIGYLDETMAVYRIHDGNYSSSRSTLDKLKLNIKIYEIMETYLDDQYSTLIHEMKAETYQIMANLCNDQAAINEAAHYSLRSLIHIPMKKLSSRKHLLKKSFRILAKWGLVKLFGNRLFLYAKRAILG